MLIKFWFGFKTDIRFERLPTHPKIKLKKIFLKKLRNQLIAHIFATNQLHKKSAGQMRRDVFQAIADPTRRAIIALIAMNAMTPNAIAEHFDTSRQAVSKHLQILSECELVHQVPAGREIYYQLNAGKMKEIDKWLEQFRKIWEGRFNELDKILANIQRKKNDQ